MPRLVPSSLFLHPRIDSDDSCIATGRKLGSGLFCSVPLLRVSVVRGVISELPSVVSSSFPIEGIVAGNKRIRGRFDCAGSFGDLGDIAMALECNDPRDWARTGVGVLDEPLNDAVPDNDM